MRLAPSAFLFLSGSKTLALGLFLYYQCLVVLKLGGIVMVLEGLTCVEFFRHFH